MINHRHEIEDLGIIHADNCLWGILTPLIWGNVHTAISTKIVDQIDYPLKLEMVEQLRIESHGR